VRSGMIAQTIHMRGYQKLGRLPQSKHKKREKRSMMMFIAYVLLSGIIFNR